MPLCHKHTFSYVCLLLQPDLIYDIGKAQTYPCCVAEIQEQQEGETVAKARSDLRRMENAHTETAD